MDSVELYLYTSKELTNIRNIQTELSIKLNNLDFLDTQLSIFSIVDSYKEKRSLLETNIRLLTTERDIHINNCVNSLLLLINEDNTNGGYLLSHFMLASFISFIESIKIINFLTLKQIYDISNILDNLYINNGLRSNLNKLITLNGDSRI